MIGVSRTTLWRLVTQGLFPAPVWISARGRGFRLAEVEEWMQARTPHEPLAEELAPGGRRGNSMPPVLVPAPRKHSLASGRDLVTQRR
jgi:hypothetical protein